MTSPDQTVLCTNRYDPLDRLAPRYFIQPFADCFVKRGNFIGWYWRCHFSGLNYKIKFVGPIQW
ncbi:hypothetical protein [Pseudomonas syringae]|uniref:Uncharacterized protein n=1 Tax=Pseudomonas syringae TaxID=317 RepID=A0AB38BX62_PSESX|nr:hypothetical protein [Pseudomonas syringae]MBS7461089.1 hypothetical protein [Pseudomonas syringae]SFO30238.1 hypothetical protein SAMN05444065_11224 [Pseudomonas syringae]SFO62825.1 hypothetical protein SAMN05444063_11224 [Pseudomonas syringae]